VKDPRWNRLADAMSAINDAVRGGADAEAQQRTPAQQDVDTLKESLSIINAECRKAYAAG